MVDQLAAIDAFSLQRKQQVTERARVSVTGISSVAKASVDAQRLSDAYGSPKREYKG